MSDFADLMKAVRREIDYAQAVGALTPERLRVTPLCPSGTTITVPIDDGRMAGFEVLMHPDDWERLRDGARKQTVRFAALHADPAPVSPPSNECAVFGIPVKMDTP